jgi:hypothetical protein
LELGCGERYRVIAQMRELYRADVGTRLGPRELGRHVRQERHFDVKPSKAGSIKHPYKLLLNRIWLIGRCTSLQLPSMVPQIFRQCTNCHRERAQLSLSQAKHSLPGTSVVEEKYLLAVATSE